MEMSVREARAAFAAAIQVAERGERVTITKHGKAVAEIGPPTAVPAKKPFDWDELDRVQERLGIPKPAAGWEEWFESEELNRKIWGDRYECRLLLDTRILGWLASERHKLSARERSAIAGADALLVSALSLMEIRMKLRSERRRGKPASIMSPSHAISFCADRRIDIVPLAADDLAVILEVDPRHGDPFDEMMLAHAQALQAKLLTRDKKLRRHPLAYQP